MRDGEEESVAVVDMVKKTRGNQVKRWRESMVGFEESVRMLGITKQQRSYCDGRNKCHFMACKPWEWECYLLKNWKDMHSILEKW